MNELEKGGSVVGVGGASETATHTVWAREYRSTELRRLRKDPLREGCTKGRGQRWGEVLERFASCVSGTDGSEWNVDLYRTGTVTTL